MSPIVVARALAKFSCSDTRPDVTNRKHRELAIEMRQRYPRSEAIGSNRMPSEWKERQEIPDPQIKDAADQYEESRRILEAQGAASGVLLPLLNNSMVAVELYLKSLSGRKIYRPVENSDWSQVYAEPRKEGHVLEDLLAAIPDEFREPLEREFWERYSMKLPETLLSYEGLFKKSRYPYEEQSELGGYPLGPLMTCSAFLHGFVAQMQPVERIQWSDTLADGERLLG
jgi:hypothetical protein